jgi:hypothetical protein
MLENFNEASETIFEVVKQVYNVPNTPLLREGMDAVAQSLDIMNQSMNEVVNYFIEKLEYIKSLEIEKVRSGDPVEASLDVIREINKILDENE